jgi:hypothetical protein
MARFFVHLNECGSVSRDEDGHELADLQEARDAALKAAREIMCAEIAEGRLCLSCQIEITDSAGEVLLVIPFRDAITISGL